jgi:hypothetical protein
MNHEIHESRPLTSTRALSSLPALQEDRLKPFFIFVCFVYFVVVVDNCKRRRSPRVQRAFEPTPQFFPVFQSNGQPDQMA